MSDQKPVNVTLTLHNMRMAGPHIDRAREAIAALSGEELADVLVPEFDRRRLDAAGNPCREPGLYEAAHEAMVALVTGRADDVELVTSLAAVGRGARLQVKDQDTVELLREIVPLVEALHASPNIAASDKAPMLAATLAKRFCRPVKEADAALGLSRPTMTGRVGVVAIACGVLKRKGGKDAKDPATRDYDISDESDRRRAADRVAKALKPQG